jgi:hypothetical protein
MGTKLANYKGHIDKHVNSEPPTIDTPGQLSFGQFGGSGTHIFVRYGKGARGISK